MVGQGIISRCRGIYLAVHLNLRKKRLLTICVVRNLFDVADFVQLTSGFHRRLVRIQIHSRAFGWQCFYFHFGICLIFHTLGIILLCFFRRRSSIATLCFCVFRRCGITAICFRVFLRRSRIPCRFIIHAACHLRHIVVAVLCSIDHRCTGTVIIWKNIFDDNRISHIPVSVIGCRDAFQQQSRIASLLVRHIRTGRNRDFRSFSVTRYHHCSCTGKKSQTQDNQTCKNSFFHGCYSSSSWPYSP